MMDLYHKGYEIADHTLRWGRGAATSAAAQQTLPRLLR